MSPDREGKRYVGGWDGVGRVEGKKMRHKSEIKKNRNEKEIERERRKEIEE